MERIETTETAWDSPKKRPSPKPAQEETIRATFRAATVTPKPATPAKPRVRGAVNEAGTFATSTTDANGETWGHFYNPKGFGC